MLAVAVVMLVRALHPFGKFLAERVDIVHHAGLDGDVLARRVEHFPNPVFALTAVVEEDVGFGDRDRVERRGFKAVGLASGGEEQRHIRAAACDGAGKIVVREERRDDLKLAVVRLFTRHGAGTEGKNKRERQK